MNNGGNPVPIERAVQETRASVTVADDLGAGFAQVEVSNFKAINKNSLIATFDLTLSSGFLFLGVLLLGKGTSQWVTFPGVPYESNGKKLYKPLVEIPHRIIRDEFNQAVIQALQDGGYI
jgi:hypothetical protein